MTDLKYEFHNNIAPNYAFEVELPGTIDIICYHKHRDKVRYTCHDIARIDKQLGLCLCLHSCSVGPALQPYQVSKYLARL